MTDRGLRSIAVFADPVVPDVARALDLAGYSWKGVASADAAADHEPADGWAGAVIDCTDASETSWAFARSLRKDDSSVPVMVLISGAQLADLELRDELFNAKIRRSTEQLENTAVLGQLRKDIARVETLLTQKREAGK